jgi:hypothetical protein
MAPGSRSGCGQGKVQGPFEAKALQLVAAGRALDFAVERYRVVKSALEQAIQTWCDALAQLPKVADGEIRNGAGPPEEPRETCVSIASTVVPSAGASAGTTSSAESEAGRAPTATRVR